jgi:hypothetical protein
MIDKIREQLATFLGVDPWDANKKAEPEPEDDPSIPF